MEILVPAATGVAGTAPSLYMRRKLIRARRHPVTGLPTRDAWTAAARRIIQRHPGAALVLMIDLDKFKAVNDTYGHAAGDTVLWTQANRLRAWCGPAGRVGHFGGDEFAALAMLPDGGVEAELARLAAMLSEPVTASWLGDIAIETGASVGAARYTDLAIPRLPQALRAADLAMYAAKRSGGGWTLAEAEVSPYRIEPAPVRRVRHHGPEATR
jgi:diguanylate cyclase (GGDEF)-like protein